MYEFTKCKSFKKLQKLSEKSLDLTDPNFITPSRIEKSVIINENFRFFYGLEKVNDEILDSLFDLAKESKVVEKMNKMQKGEIVNFIKGYESENRKALHTATRDFFSDKIENEASNLAWEEVEKLRIFLEKFEYKFTDIIQIGIGGSILGVKTIYNGLLHIRKKNIYFVSNIDPDDIYSVIKKVDLSKTLVISVSKSGTTLETLANEAFIREELKKRGMNPIDHMVCVTSKNSPMDDKDKYLETFYIWDYICGRFSHTSMVGGVAVSLAFGIDVYMEILKGANFMDKIARKEDRSNLPLFSALLRIWNRNFLNFPTYAVISYSKALFYFIQQIQQYEMESNGKSIDKKGKKISFLSGPIVWGDIGTNAQHSFFQFLYQGMDISPVEFIGFQKSQYGKDMKIENTTFQEKLLSNLFAQAIALAIGKKDKNPNKSFEGNRPSSILLFEKLTPFSLGMLFSYYEHKIVFQGFIWDINSFDQEGVQFGKTLSKKMMKLFSKEEEFPLGEAFIKNMIKKA